MTATAATIASHLGAEGASAAHVEQAVGAVWVRRRNRKAAVQMALGGIAAGTGLSGLVTSPSQTTPPPWLLAFALVSSGGTWHVARGIE